MIGAMMILAAVSQQSSYIAPCSLPSGATFFEKLEIVPEPILTDFRLNIGRLANSGESINLSDTIHDPKLANTVWRYVLNVGDKWFIIYMHGGIVIQNITVAYEEDFRSKARYIGAVAGDPCAAYDYFLGKAGITVIEGWRRFGSTKTEAKRK